MRIAPFFLFAWLVGCTHLPATPTTLAEDPDFAPPESAVPAGLREDPAIEFRLAPGDVLTLRTMSATEAAYEGLMVDEQGLLHAPLVGDVAVGGLSLAAAEVRLETALRNFDRAIRVNIVITSAGGHMATVLGAVHEPGRIAVTPGMRVADLLAAAGGPIASSDSSDPTEPADLESAQLLRDGVALPISLALAVTGDRLHNVRVRAGDHLFVPSSRGATITILGEVESATVLGYRRGMRLTTALALAGGLSADAHRRDVRVVRGSLAAPRVYRTDLHALVDGNGTDVELAPGDIVFVTRTGLAGVRDVMTAMSPLLFAAQNVGLGIGLSRAARRSTP